MPFLTWNNGTLGVLPNLQGIGARTPVAYPALVDMWGVFSQSFENPWWSSYINCVSCTWLDNLYVFRLFPESEYGPIDDSIHKVFSADYGNIIDDILDPWTVLNTRRVTIDHSNLQTQGNTAGFALTQRNETPPQAPPNPPLPDPLAAAIVPIGSLPPGGELEFDVAIDGQTEHSSVGFMGCLDWAEVAGSYDVPSTWEVSLTLCFVMRGQRAVFICFEPDWKEAPPRVRFTFPDDLFESDSLVEQRVTALAAPDPADPASCDNITRQITRFKTGQTDGTELWLKLTRAGHRRVAYPFWAAPMTVTVDPSSSTIITITNFRLDFLIFASAEIAVINRKTRDYETRVVTSIDRVANTITVSRPWSLSASPYHLNFYMVMYGQIEGKPGRVWKSDVEQEISVVWRSI